MSLSLEAGTFIAFEKLNPGNPELESFIFAQPHHLFQTSAWGGILEKGYGIRVSNYVLKLDGQIALALPAAIFDFGLFRICHAGTPYGGFAGDYALIPEFLERLTPFLKKEKIDMLRITQNVDQAHPALPGFQTTAAYQHAIDLTGGEASAGFHKNAQRNLKKAEREGLTLRTIQGADDIALYYEMYVLAMKRLRTVRPHTRRLYEEIYTRLILRKQGTILFAAHETKTVAGILLLYDRDTVYFLGSAFHPEAHALRPNDFLMARAIEHARTEGFSRFDFMTTGASQAGLVQYKEKWGAVSAPFRVHEKSLSPFKGAAWNFLWKLANTPPVSSLIETVRKERS